jgi:hypothetical protein
MQQLLPLQLFVTSLQFNPLQFPMHIMPYPNHLALNFFVAIDISKSATHYFKY